MVRERGWWGRGARGARGAVVMVTLSVTAWIGLPAAAEPPEVTPPESIAGLAFELPAGEGCDFGTVIEVLKGKEGSIEFADRAILTAPGLEARVSRADDPSVFVDLQVSGTWHDTYTEEGILRTATGQNLFFPPPEQEDQYLLWTTGRVELFADETSLVVLDTRSARIVDVCALLS